MKTTLQIKKLNRLWNDERWLRIKEVKSLVGEELPLEIINSLSKGEFVFSTKRLYGKIEMLERKE